MVRASVLAALATGLIVTPLACGGGDVVGPDPDQPQFGPGDAGVFGVPVEAPPSNTQCVTDQDCGGLADVRCRDLGGTRACVRSRSCTGKIGADARCGGQSGDERAVGTDDCCAMRAVPGGSYLQFNDPAYPATVSAFALDVYEVTAGRFRAWVDATDGDLRSNAPAEGAAAHPKIPGSGWRTEWNALLPASRSEVDAILGATCQVGSNVDDYGALTWWSDSIEATVKSAHKNDPDILAENTKDALDRKPLNCVPWYVLFAFCAWDGGRLPTNAEWGFAAAGGAEQRAFPWGGFAANELVHVAGVDELSLVPVFSAGRTFTTALLYDPKLGPNEIPDYYAFTWGRPNGSNRENAAHIAPVGRKVLGNGRWGHADLAGGVHEWMLDEGPIRPGACRDCANVSFPKPDARDPNAYNGLPDEFDERWYLGGARAIRGGAWDNSYALAIGQSQTEIETYTSYPVGRTYRSLGGRCARSL